MASNPLILVTGASGYVGGSLVPRLLEKGYRVRILARDRKTLSNRSWFSQVEIVQGDLLMPLALEQAMLGIYAAYYLVHNMASGRNYYQKEIESARNFSFAASNNDIQHVIYLGGLVDPNDNIGMHMRSRLQTGDTLRQGTAPVTEFRASLIIGSGSISFELIRYLTDQIPLMIGPRWIKNHTQPVAIQNVLDYLLAALENPDCRGKIYEIGGKDILTYAEVITTYAQIRGLMKRSILPLAGIQVEWMAKVAGILTPVPASIAEPLLGGMQSDSLVRDDMACKDFPAIQPIGYSVSVRQALEQLTPACLDPVWENDAASFKFRHRGFFIEGRQVSLEASPQRVYNVIACLGGRRGWLYLNSLWRLRGFLDRLAGGPGLRGRRMECELSKGDVVDFYRVETLEVGRMIRLRTELVAPGIGWMEWHIQPQLDGNVRLSQVAYFAPKGLPGFLYWYLLLPFHRKVFIGLLKAIVRRIEQTHQ